MNESQLLTVLKHSDVSGLPDVHALEDDRLQVFWMLRALKGSEGPHGLTPAQISDLLRDGCGISIPRQRVAAILAKENGSVARRKITGKQHFRIMKSGEDLLQQSTSSPIFIDPAKALSNIRKVEEIFGSLSGGVRVCDPYVDNRTLDFLAKCVNATSIKLLTVNVYKDSQFKRDLRAYIQEHGGLLEVRVFGHGQLHDRYVIHDGGMLLIGASLNGIGLKQSFIVAVGEDLKASATISFDKTWNRAAPYTVT